MSAQGQGWHWVILGVPSRPGFSMIHVCNGITDAVPPWQRGLPARAAEGAPVIQRLPDLAAAPPEFRLGGDRAAIPLPMKSSFRANPAALPACPSRKTRTDSSHSATANPSTKPLMAFSSCLTHHSWQAVRVPRLPGELSHYSRRNGNFNTLCNNLCHRRQRVPDS